MVEPNPKPPDNSGHHKHRKPRSRNKRELDRAEIWELTLKGWNQYQIAERLGLSTSCISTELKAIVAERRDFRLDSLEEYRDLVTSQYLMIYKEASEAWEASKDPSTKVVEEEALMRQNQSEDKPAHTMKLKGKGPGTILDKKNKIDELKAELKLIKRTKTTSADRGSSEYLRVMALCLDAIRDLHGLNAPKEVNIKQATINWDILIDAIPDGPTPDVLDQAIRDSIHGLPDTAREVLGLNPKPTSITILPDIVIDQPKMPTDDSTNVYSKGDGE